MIYRDDIIKIKLKHPPPAGGTLFKSKRARKKLEDFYVK